MDPVAEASDLLRLLRFIDEGACVLHGHKHEVMSPEYRFEDHQVSCPGAFFQSLRLNLLDRTVQGNVVVTQLAVRHPTAV